MTKARQLDRLVQNVWLVPANLPTLKRQNHQPYTEGEETQWHTHTHTHTRDNEERRSEPNNESASEMPGSFSGRPDGIPSQHPSQRNDANIPNGHARASHHRKKQTPVNMPLQTRDNLHFLERRTRMRAIKSSRLARRNTNHLDLKS